MATLVGALALTSISFTTDAGFYRWTAYSKANCWGHNKSVAWYNEHYLNYKTDSKHYNEKRDVTHMTTTTWQFTDKSETGHYNGEIEGKIMDKWFVQGYHHYQDPISKKPVYHWYSDAVDCNVFEDTRFDYPVDWYP